MFLNIWLRRKEQEVKHTLILSAGLSEMVNAAGHQSNVPARFKEYLESVFPFVINDRSKADKDRLEALSKEMAKGPITFSPIETNHFKKVVERLNVPDEFKQKLRERARKQPRLR